MLFGNEEDFAVELEAFRGEAQRGSTWFAHVRYWIHRDVIGDFDQAVVLSSELGELRDILAWRGKRHARELLALPESEALNRVYETLWGRTSGGYSAVFGSSIEDYLRFWILPRHSEAFQGERAIVLCSDGTEKVIWQVFGSAEVRARTLAAGTFDAVLAETVTWCAELLGHRG